MAHNNNHFYKANNEGYIASLDGVERKTLVFGEKTLLTEFRMQKGKDLPMHQHPHEQTGYLVSGKIEFTIGDETKLMLPGDSWIVPGNTMHGGKVLEYSVAIEVFSPVREEYLP